LFTPSHAAKFIEDASTGVGDQFYTKQNQLDQILAANKVADKSKKAKLQFQFSKMRDGYRQLNEGREPDQDQMDKMIKQLMADYPREWSIDKPVYEEIEAGAVTIGELLLRDEPEQNLNTAREEFEKRFNRQPRPSEFLRWYGEAKKRGMF
jgi:hypothetical protein